jgi:hypothetical protein
MRPRRPLVRSTHKSGKGLSKSMLNLQWPDKRFGVSSFAPAHKRSAGSTPALLLGSVCRRQ